VLERWLLLLRGLRLVLLLSILASVALVAMHWKGIAPQWTYAGGLILTAWVALCAAASLLLQLIVLIRWRRDRRRTQGSAAVRN
jgi:hypothetical protein